MVKNIELEIYFLKIWTKYTNIHATLSDFYLKLLNEISIETREYEARATGNG